METHTSLKNHRYGGWSLAILAALLASSSTALADPSYTFNYTLNVPGYNDLNNVNNDNPNGYYAITQAINNNGDVAGYYSDFSTQQAFVNQNSYSYGNTGNAGALGSTSVSGINTAGNFVGNYADPGLGNEAGFYNAAGNKAATPTAILADNNSHGSSVVQTLAGGINDNGVVVGWDTLQNGTQNIYTHNVSGNSYTDLSVTISSVSGITGEQGLAINNAGWIVGDYSDASNAMHGFLYNGASWVSIDDPNAAGGSTVATGINNKGEVVGWYSDSTGLMHGFTYDGNTNTWINAKIDDPNSSGGTQLFGINDKGVIVGASSDTLTSYTLSASTAVPLPASAWFMATWLAGLGFCKRRKVID